SAEYPDGVTVHIPSISACYDDVGDDIMAQLQNGSIEYSVQKPKTTPWWVSIVIPIVIVGIILGVWFFIMQQQGGARSGGFTKSHVKLGADEKRKVCFNDVAGAAEEKAELEELVEFLKHPQKFIKLGARIPKGVLLVGQPGTGKTLLARAVAGEAGVPFFSISGSDFVELYVGVGAARVRDLFEQAKKNRPCIIFIDEIDAVGRRRGAGMGGGHDEREQTLNQLLVEMDGFSANEGVIIIAATNRPDILDPALLRPGRFDRQVVVDVPDIRGREEILVVHSKNKTLTDEVDLKKLAKGTAGYTGADLENLMNEAAIFAARRDKSAIDNKDLEDANIKIMMGAEKKSKIITESEKRLTAYHEAGHAIVAKIVDKTCNVHQVSIIPRGRAGGYTMYLPDEDKSYISKNDMLNRIMVLLAGRVAEKLVLDDISSGASGDIQRATEIVRGMVTKYGMSDNIGPVSYESEQEVFLGRDYGHSKNYSEKTASEIDEEISSIITEQYEKTITMLQENMDTLERVAQALIERETIDDKEFDAIFNNTENGNTENSETVPEVNLTKGE
ncbi:MAG: ATP-dependent zinc metalloprotease FtsH, partial [Oscillospiraceae bacterium]|nr:ATP-dependent zinc metalloprotease FtsH [Oscillospiraceae bacterium]